MTLNPSIASIPIPERIKSLSLGPNGYPVPWFVAWVGEKPEFRAMDPVKLVRAVRESRCWVCGQRMTREKSFVIGPMCAVTRTNAEPPSHPECALYSVRACPFLTRPHMVRRENDLPEGAGFSAGLAIKRNPGCCAIWTRAGAVDFFPDRPTGGILFKIGEPTSVTWWCEGRPATRDEVLDSIESGIPLLGAESKEERLALAQMLVRAKDYLHHL